MQAGCSPAYEETAELEAEASARRRLGAEAADAGLKARRGRATAVNLRETSGKRPDQAAPSCEGRKGGGMVGRSASQPRTQLRLEGRMATAGGKKEESNVLVELILSGQLTPLRSPKRAPDRAIVVPGPPRGHPPTSRLRSIALLLRCRYEARLTRQSELIEMSGR
jgi:hypothetical protein